MLGDGGQDLEGAHGRHLRVGRQRGVDLQHGVPVADRRELGRRRRGLGLDRVAVVAAADEAAEALDERRRIEALGAVGVDGVDRARERVQAGEQDVDDLAGQARAALAQQLEDVLHLVREGRHALEAHGRGHALQGVGDAEDRVDGLAILGRLLEAHDGEVELLEVLPALGQEHRKVLGGIHQSFR